MRKAEKFNQGYMLTELLAAAELDMQWHTLPATDAAAESGRVRDRRRWSEDASALATVPPRYRSSYFAHIWANGYAAGYYAYLWSEMLDDDAYQWFDDHGGLTRANGERFRKMVLSQGNTEDLGKMYAAWLGGGADSRADAEGARAGGGWGREVSVAFSPETRWVMIAGCVALSHGWHRYCWRESLTAQPAPTSAALDKLFADAEAQHSNAVFVYQNEQPVRTEFFKAKDQRIYLYSVTKVFSGLAIGIAYDKGLIPSIDEPVSTWFPEMANDPLKSKIKLRHLLQHSSGILTTQGSQDIYPQHDFVKFALESPVVSTPGEEVKYNNRAVNIESGIIRKVTGRSMEEWLAENLFKPLGITDYKFHHDDAGNTWAMDGLELKASDMVKIACVLADDGKWQGRQIVSEKWLAVATRRR